MKKVLLNSLPPTALFKPGYSLSVIKPFLSQHGYDVTIKYWNLFLKEIISEFWFHKMDKIKLPWLFKDLMPFFSYIAIENSDTKVLNRIQNLLLEYFPDKNISEHLNNAAISLEKVIYEELKNISICDYDYVYVQSKFYKYELISTGVFCKILKKYFPDITTIIEAQEFPRKAMALMDSFDCYDYATWGEYELPLLYLLNSLSNLHNIEECPNIVYRDTNGRPTYSKNKITEHINMNEAPFADFSDYMEQSDIPIQHIIFPLEGVRGCHWNKCSFCYMNDGYKFRKKKPERIAEEIKYYIDKYGAEFFYFIDNDMIGGNVDDFNILLTFLKEIKEKHQPNLRFEFGEVVAHCVNADIIKSIQAAGFLEIQIGYESTSDLALQLMHKKSRFAHLILASRWSLYYGMTMSPQNILRSMPFETDEIVLDCIKNLYYLRFLLSDDRFTHSLRELCIVSTSRYFEQIKQTDNLILWDTTPMQEYMIENYIKAEYKYDVFLMQTKKFNPLWELFKHTEKFYRDKLFSYKLTKNEHNTEYIEYVSNKISSKMILTQDDCNILELCNRKVISLKDLYKNFDNKDVSLEYIREKVLNLKHKGIIYMSENENEIVSIIDINSFIDKAS